VTRKDAAALAAVLLLVTLAFADLLSTKRVLFLRDVSRIHVPERIVLRAAIHDGLPYWNPHWAGGHPLAANPGFQLFYPPHWLIFLPSFLLGFALEIVVHFLLAAAGMFLLLRSLRLRAEAAAFGALTFALGGVMLSLTNLLPFFFAITWWPWIGFFANRLFDERKARDFALASLALGMLLLVGEPATVLQSGLLLLAFAFARIRPAHAIGWTAALCVAATLVAAAQLVPTLDFARDIGRAGAAIPGKWRLPPARPLEILGLELDPGTPAVMAHWLLTLYSGMLAAALLVAGFVHRVRGWLFAAAVTVAGYLLALGAHVPLVRYPEKWFVPAAFVLIVFAAIAAERFLDDPRFRRTTHIAAGALVVVNAAGGITRGLVVAVALTLILFLRGRLLLVLLATLVVVDLGARAPVIAPRTDASYYTESPAIARSIPPGARIYNDADWVAYALQKPPVPQAIRDTMLPEVQTLWGFDSVLESDVGDLFLPPTRDFERLFLRTRFGPRNAAVPQLLAAAGVTHTIVEGGRVIAMRNGKLHFAGRTERVRETTNALDADVDAAAGARLFIAVTPHKFWHATIDDAPAPLVRANVGFQAIDVPAGRHHVAMRYRNPLVMPSAIVSLIAAAALATAAALRSKAPRPPSPR
jgi:hypothetical protein